MSKTYSPEELDKLIEEALASEPMRSAPTGLHRRIDSRLQVEAAVIRERTFARRRVVAVVGAVLFVLVAAAAGVRTLDLLSQALGAMPGMLGYADYLRSFYLNGPAQTTLAIALTACACAGATLLMGAAWVGAVRDRRFGH